MKKEHLQLSIQSDVCKSVQMSNIILENSLENSNISKPFNLAAIEDTPATLVNENKRCFRILHRIDGRAKYEFIDFFQESKDACAFHFTRKRDHLLKNYFVNRRINEFSKSRYGKVWYFLRPIENHKLM